MAKQIFVSKDGYLKLQNELEHLKTVKRAEIAQAIKKARSFGDLSENSEYDEAKNEQAEIETKIAQLEETIKNATVLDDTQLKTDKVSVGNKVRIYNVRRRRAGVFHRRLDRGRPVCQQNFGRLAAWQSAHRFPRGRHDHRRGAGRHSEIHHHRNRKIIFAPTAK